MIDIILTIVLIIVSVVLFAIAFMYFKEKGFLFNNAYIFATKEQREGMDKKLYYRQSAIVFTLLGVIFLLNSLEMILKTDWLFYAVLVIVIITVIYAIVSSIRIK